MATRRQFLQGSLATSGLLLTRSTFGPSRQAIHRIPGMRQPLHGLVCEQANPHGHCFAIAARGLGLQVFGIGDDITPVWVHLQSLWRSTPIAVGGLTTFTPLLLLEQSGRDYGLRIVFRAEHLETADSTVNHTLRGPREVLRAFGEAAACGCDFGGCAALALARCPTAPTDDTATLSLRTPVVTGRTFSRTLYSWVLVPRRARTQGAHA